MNLLTEKTYLITGGGRGLGRQAARALGALGARVMVSDINPDSAAETARLVEAAGGRSSVYIADISKKFPVQALLNAVEDAWGRLDGLVNNARVTPRKAVLDIDEWDWRRTLDVNLSGAFLLAQVAGRLLRASGGGHIIQPLQEASDTTGLSAYRASLGGLKAFADAIIPELEAVGVHYALVTYRHSEDMAVVEEILGLLKDNPS